MAFEGQVFDNPEMTNTSSFFDNLNYINNLTDTGSGGVLGLLILIIIGASLFGIMKAFSFDKSLSVSLFITSILGIFLRIMGLINDGVLTVCIVLFVISLFLLFQKSDRSI